MSWGCSRIFTDYAVFPVRTCAGSNPGKRQSRHGSYRAKLDVPSAAPPVPLADAARVMRNHGRYPIYPTPGLNLWDDRLSRRRDSTSWVLPSTSALLLTQRFRPQLLDGDELAPPRARAYGWPALVLPRPALCPVWHRQLSGIGRGFRIAPSWRCQALYQ
jgi:hypothetical protein